MISCDIKQSDQHYITEVWITSTFLYLTSHETPPMAIIIKLLQHFPCSQSQDKVPRARKAAANGVWSSCSSWSSVERWWEHQPGLGEIYYRWQSKAELPVQDIPWLIRRGNGGPFVSPGRGRMRKVGSEIYACWYRLNFQSLGFPFWSILLWCRL